MRIIRAEIAEAIPAGRRRNELLQAIAPEGIEGVVERVVCATKASNGDASARQIIQGVVGRARRDGGQLSPDLQEELVAANLAVQLAFRGADRKPRYPDGLRPVQLLAVAALVNVALRPLSPGGPGSAALKGLLLQVLTGEGKALIIAVTAALLALSGRTVDVITTAETLAAREVTDGEDDKRPLLALFGLEAGHNCGNGSGGTREGFCDVYAKPIVYGTVGSFEADWLFHAFKAFFL